MRIYKPMRMMQIGNYNDANDTNKMRMMQIGDCNDANLQIDANDANRKL